MQSALPAVAGRPSSTLSAALAAGDIMLSTILLDLSFQDVIGGIPHDFGALVALLLLGSFVAFIWIGSRSNGAAKRTGSTPAGGTTAPSKKPHTD
jgi:hypothetical protein